MHITHRCPSCGDFSAIAGTCAFCDLEFRPLEAAAEDAPASAPAPDWPDAELDQRERRTARRRPARVDRPRRAAV